MGKRKFTREELLDDDVLDSSVYDEITSHSRWSVHHKAVFTREGKFWQTTYSVGATESQDEVPWEYMNEVECEEVELKEVVVKTWVPK